MFRTVVIAVGLAFASGGAFAADQPVSLSALKTDIGKFRGKRIDVSGHLNILGEVATLGMDAADSRTVLVELANLSHDQRQALTSKCGFGCDVRIRGKGGLVLRDPGVIATDVSPADEVPAKVASTAN